MNFERRGVEWTPESIRRFWDYLSANDPDAYFARQVGMHLVDYVASRIDIGTALDLGCGRGDLINFLVQRTDTYGSDQSPDSVAEVNQRFRDHPRFLGASVGTNLPLVDTVFILEVVEHLNDEALDRMLSDARRLLKPGGHLVITTPNNEDLDSQKVMCPDCGCIFHRMQHVRSWTTSSLEQTLSQFGFTGSATPMLLSNKSGWKRPLHVLYHRLRGLKPNLVYIGSLGQTS